MTGCFTTRKNLKAEGYGKGFDTGITTVDQNRLIQQITKKVKADKPLEQITSEVEETVEDIREMYEQIVEELHTKQ